ncbi:MAG TPA: hypothetical protein VG389_17615 [Myxococcota bacterium]|jgi:hypothetical protein|nr:hypothetical protein [Myxococcota bacterium]
MITEISIDDLVLQGSRRRAPYLIEQSGYTLGIAAEDGAAIDDLLDPGYVAEVATAADEVRTAMGDKALMAEDSKTATDSQDEQLRRAKVWRRRAVRRAQRAVRQGRTVPDLLTSVKQARTVPGLIRQLDQMVPALAANQAALGGANAQALIDDGTAIRAALHSADAAQELARLSALPAKVRDFFEAKGRLYVGLKVINDAGHELHADNAAAAGRYNLRILHRRTGAGRRGGSAQGGTGGGTGT